MTNEAIAMGVQLANTNAVVEVVFRDYPSPSAAIWLISLFIIPVASVVIFARCWKSRRRIGGATWHVHALLLAALVMATTTACSVFSVISQSFSCAGAHPSGASTQMCCLAICRACFAAIIGILATSFSLALAIVASMIKKSNDRKP